MNIWEIPFAAITICPVSGFMPLNENYNLTDMTGENALHNFTDSIGSRITNTRWRNIVTDSNNLFSEIATAEGFCYTFNMMNFDDLFEDNV